MMQMNAIIKLDATLRQFAQNKDRVRVKGYTVADCLKDLIRQFPHIEEWLFDKNGILKSLILLDGNPILLKNFDQNKKGIPSSNGGCPFVLSGFNCRVKPAASVKKEKGMRQKFVISRNVDENSLKIREYAILTRIPKNTPALAQPKEQYSLLGQEIYDDDIVETSISRGKRYLVATLRTNNLFPIQPYANKIAESVMELYKTENGEPAELFFDDVDLLPIIEE